MSFKNPVPILATIVFWCAGCSFYFNNPCERPSDCPGADAAADGDTDGDTDADTDIDSDTCGGDTSCADLCGPPFVCIEEITGNALYENQQPLSVRVKLCINHQKPNDTTDEKCFLGLPNESGELSFTPPGAPYWRFDFAGGNYIHFTVPELITPTYANYVVGYAPKEDQIDNGRFDLGTHILHELTEPHFSYNPSDGVIVNTDFVSFELQPGELGDDEQTIRVEQFAPAQLPFLSQLGPVDAVYYLSPYLANFIGQNSPVRAPHFVDIRFNGAMVGGWEAGASGKLYMLGDHHNGQYLDCGQGEVENSALAICDDTVFWQNGYLHAAIPCFGWVALVQDD